jgi:formate/nitrite transporter FocA (FNT family)
VPEAPQEAPDAADGGGGGEEASGDGPTSEQLVSTFHRTVEEGEDRLERTLPALLATGVVGGLDVSLGVLAMYFVRAATHNAMLGALAFSIGFIALTLASSELFTENFLVPVAAMVAGRASPWRLLRLWAGTLVANLAGAWVLTGLALAGFPQIHRTALEVAHPASVQPLDARSLANMVIAGTVITLMTWMERSTESVPGKLTAAIVAAFLLAAGSMSHAIVVSVEFFGALHAGASFGYVQWLGWLGWAVLGNMIGGLGLVTMLRMVQVGRRTLAAEH